MSAGSGKYHDITAEARHKAQAAGVVLIVLEGEKGFGFEVQVGPEYLTKIPEMLRAMANEVEADLRHNLPGVLRAAKVEPPPPPKASGKN